MKNSLNTRYVGNTEKWLDFWLCIAKNQNFHAFFGLEDGQRLLIEINKILSLNAANHNLYQKKIQAYPFEISNSFKNMWLSGTVDIFENIFNYFKGYQNEFKPNLGSHYFKLFLNPNYIFQIKDNLKYKSQFDILCSIYPFMKERAEQCVENDINPSSKEFYTYPHDEYVNPLSFTNSSMDEMFLVCEGEIEVDGGALFVFADEPFADGEYEVGVWSYSESSWQRYQTIPEPFLYTLAYILFEAEVHSVDELLRVNPVFQLLYR